MARINIIYQAYFGKITGLERDALVLESTLKERHQTNLCKIIGYGRFKNLGLLQTLSSKATTYLKASQSPFDLNIFIEGIQPEFLPLARINLLIPNQEIFTRSSASELANIDGVLCKTDYARHIFAPLTPRLQSIGFTTADRRQPDQQPDYSQFFHLAGRSGNRRGTHQILRFWQTQPQLPKLTVVAHGLDPAPYRACANLQIFNHYITDRQVRQLQNQIGIHICLSQAEGYGHFIAEAMSAQACVITTDGPPMNELITPERGYLVQVGTQTSVEGYFDQRFHFNPAAFEATVRQLAAAPIAEKQAKGEQARCWYEQNQQAFRQNLERALDEILARHISSTAAPAWLSWRRALGQAE